MADSFHVLIIGSGGREHALAWAVARSPLVSRITVAPGNAGTEWTATENRAAAQNTAIQSQDIEGIVNFAREHAVDLVIVGPEVPLSLGLVDALSAAGILAFGPTKAAAQIEASKAFAKAFMSRHGIPTAAYGAFEDYGEALEFIHNFGKPVVVKADGLAAGKGVVVCDTTAEAEAAIRHVLLDGEFGAAGAQVVIEERLSGVEVSALAFCDGERAALMPLARDHKRIFDGDQGPNTGGMGAYAPIPDSSNALRQQILDQAISPVLRGMAAECIPYRGVLYAGLMLTPDGMRVLEYNCRFGDPETQALLPLLASDLVEHCLACAQGNLDPASVQWLDAACATVVMASGGYPGNYQTGIPIHFENAPEGKNIGRDTSRPYKNADHSSTDDTRSRSTASTRSRERDRGESCIIFHAGTARKDGEVVTAGGRVLAVSALGGTLEAALENAYCGVNDVSFEGAHFRRDIGQIYGR